MHHLRLTVRGPTAAANTLRDRLVAAGARRCDERGRRLVLATATPPDVLREQIFEGLKGAGVRVERFEVLGPGIIEENWRRSGIERGYGWGPRLFAVDEEEAAHERARWDYSGYGEVRQPPRPRQLTSAVATAARGVACRRSDPGWSGLDGALVLLAALGSAAATRALDDPHLVAAAVAALDLAALAATREAAGTDTTYERARVLSVAARRAEPGRAAEDALTELSALSAALLEAVRFQGLLSRIGLESIGTAALTRRLEVLAADMHRDSERPAALTFVQPLPPK